MTDIDEIFNDSYERCLKKGDLISRFYAKYVLSNEIVAEKFSHTDMAKQKRMLEASLHMVMALSSAKTEKAEAHFQRIGIAHGRKQHNIAPYLYDLWMTSLLAAVEECDDQYDEQVKAAWTELISNSINIMKSMY